MIINKSTFVVKENGCVLYVLLFAIITYFSACGEKIEDFNGFLKSEVALLISANDTKNWTRTAIQVNGQPLSGDCYDSLIYQFTYFDNKVDTLGLVFIQPNPSTCGIANFKNTYPEIWKVDSSFCVNKPDECKSDEGYYFAGSWYIADPFIKNGKVDEIIIENSFDSLIYQINFITSIYLEFSTKNEDNLVFEKFVAE